MRVATTWSIPKKLQNFSYICSHVRFTYHSKNIHWYKISIHEHRKTLYINKSVRSNIVFGLISILKKKSIANLILRSWLKMVRKELDPLLVLWNQSPYTQNCKKFCNDIYMVSTFHSNAMHHTINNLNSELNSQKKQFKISDRRSQVMHHAFKLQSAPTQYRVFLYWDSIHVIVTFRHPFILQTNTLWMYQRSEAQIV